MAEAAYSVGLREISGVIVRLVRNIHKGLRKIANPKVEALKSWDKVIHQREYER